MWLQEACAHEGAALAALGVIGGEKIIYANGAVAVKIRE